MSEETQHGVLVAKRNGIYTVYVFKLDNGEYIMCTKLPNWGTYDININDSGFITTQFFKAGEQYYNRDTESFQLIQYTNMYFKDFIKDNEKMKDIIL